MMIKIAIVEDNTFLMRTIIEKLDNPEILIKYKAFNGKEIIDLLQVNNTLDVILMDIEMPILNGIEATREIKTKYPQIKIIINTVFDNDENIFNAIKAGADGYLLKDVDSEKLIEAIRDILKGGAVMTPSIAMKTLKLLKNPVDFSKSEEVIQLSEREIEVLEQLSKGLKNKDIASNLNVSFFTVKKHIENIYRKLQAHNRIELIQKARENRLI
ncbi:response regulator transcription factor [Flavobacterium aquaticum]|uniref:Response regulator transcription factor n=2 Tax=Flavobacterium proteolyticum TaxID=2911683 RepID=A0ABR9WMT3_9FLAO|nr:response regulator transcription factor [Flavobacterium proteolyticum]